MPLLDAGASQASQFAIVGSLATLVAALLVSVWLLWRFQRSQRSAELRQARSDLVTSQAMLVATEARNRLALQAASIGTWDVDFVGNVRTWSVETEALFGLAPGTFRGTWEAFLDLIHIDDLRAIEIEHATAKLERRGSISRFRTVWSDGSVHWIEEISRPQYAADGTLMRITGTSMDITERKKAEEALQHQALHDELTGLTNRTLLQDRLSQAILTAGLEHTPVSLLLVDLDRFKEINDTFGHHYGDLLLQQIGPRLHATLRTSDTVARLGGDEFGILLPTADSESAVAVAHQLLRILEAPFELDGEQVEIGASIGIASYPAHGTDTATLLRRADVAMYVAKRGESGVVVYTAEQDHYSAERLALGGELRSAIENGELLLHYQPKLDLRDGSLVGVEALVRWQHPLRGFLPPGVFIPLAEQTGLIHPLTRWVIEAGLRQAQAWRSLGLDIPVAVNLSRRSLQDPQLPEMVESLLARYDAQPSALVLEITESSLMTDLTHVGQNLRQLRALGVDMSIDDFGTGYSSLASLKNLPVDELKIDQSFVQAMATDASARAIVRAIIDLADALNLRVVAEGVEDRATWDVLAGLGCDIAQGYFLSRPLAAPDLEAWVADVSPTWQTQSDRTSLKDALQDRIRGRGARLTAEEEFIARKHAEQALGASEERNRLALQAARMGTWEFDPTVDVLTWSPEMEVLHGLAPGSFGQTSAALQRVVVAEDWQALSLEMQSSFTERRDTLATYRVMWPDGSVHWLEGKGRGVYAVDGTLQRMTGTAMDITERKLAAEALSRSEAQLAEAQQIAHVGSWELDLGNQQLSWSAEHCRIFGLDPGEDSRTFVDSLRYIHSEDRASLTAALNGAISACGSYTTDVRIVRQDGAVRLIRNHGAFVAGDNTESARLVGTAQDITERVDSDRHQAQQASHINSLLASTSEGIYGITPDGRCSFINTAGAAVLGYTPDELVGRPMHTQVHHKHANGTPYPIETCPLYATLRSGVACHIETDVLWHRDGTPLVVEVDANPVLQDERLAGIVVAFRDVTARTRAEASLRESELRLRLALEIAGLGTWDWNLERDQFVSSGVVERMLGLEPGGLGNSPSDFLAFVHEDDRPALTLAVADSLEGAAEFRAEFRVRRVDGVVRWISTAGQIFRDRDGRPVRMFSVTRDVTEGKQAEAQRETFQRSEKLRALGQMATGIAHDINRSLMPHR